MLLPPITRLLCCSPILTLALDLHQPFAVLPSALEWHPSSCSLPQSL